MKIQVLGSGCPTCHKLYDLTKKAAIELGLEEKVEYVTDVSKIVEMGVMSSPVLAINGKPVLAGFIPDLDIIKSKLQQEAGSSSCCNSSSCNCKDNSKVKCKC